VLRRRDWLMIQERIRQGVYIKDVAAELGVHPRTVSRALKRGGSPPGERPAARKSKLDRYKPVIDRLLAAGVWNAAVILREIQEQGYSGQASILRDYIRPKRPLRQARATVRFETAPGEQLQNDWAKYRTLLVEGARSAISLRHARAIRAVAGSPRWRPNADPLRHRGRGGQPQCSYLLGTACPGRGLPPPAAARAAAAGGATSRGGKKYGRLIPFQGCEGIFQVMTNRTDRHPKRSFGASAITGRV
jgi:hypothetical protein